MQNNTIGTIRQINGWVGRRCYTMALLGLVLMALVGQPLESSLGMATSLPGYPPGQSGVFAGVFLGAGWRHLSHTWLRALVRSELLVSVWLLSSRTLPSGVALLPWARWLVEGLAVAWPWLGQQPELRLMRWGLDWLRWGMLMLLVGDAARQQGALLQTWRSGHCSIGSLGILAAVIVKPDCQAGEPSEAQVTVTATEKGYRIDLEGEFHLTVNRTNRFWLRMTILFLRQLEGVTPRKGSRATRDGRRPLVPQQKLAAWFEVAQPHISLWEKWWLAGDWANLMSLNSAQVLTVELRDQIVDVFARFPWRGAEWVYTHLRQQGVAVTYAQVKQAARDSGWARLKQTMRRFFVLSPDCIHPRDESLQNELLALVDRLMNQMDQGAGFPRQLQLEIAHLKAAATELGFQPTLPEAVPWVQKLNWVLFAAQAPLQDGVVRCTYCGCPAERRKGLKPRARRYRDERNEWQTVEVYRYYCDNPACPYGSFTHLPLGLLPHSPYLLALRLQVLQMYAWGRSSYRRTAQACGIGPGRACQWVQAFGQDLLPVAALFGVVRSSGVVGVDEKWVQVPDKAARGSGRTRRPRRRRWMYVYLAVDVYTYDLLHIAIYAHNTAASTRTFLLALKAKGYCPTVIVTDLRPEYGPAIAQVYPKARHHECIFHAMRWFHTQIKEAYGADYAKTHPEAAELKKQIKAALQSKTQRTAQKRYRDVISLRQSYVARQPEAAAVFDSLERHWPKLINGIESAIVPKTNNAVELIIRRFEQHYQNFCGFETLASARLFLGVFEKVYRFTPFTSDAQERVRGKCPLELAGYDIVKLPMAQVCRGWALACPLNLDQEAFPNV